ncbi:MAG: hypothetical protein JNK35_11395 [Phycisphaerae bacterium]|nr:hypothetical protein [Phycisphaerae bacterium]
MNAPLGPARSPLPRRTTPLALASLIAMLASGPALAQTKPSTQPATPATSPPPQPPAGNRTEPAPPATTPATPATPGTKPPAPAANAAPAPTGLVRIEPARIEVRASEGAAELRRVWPDSGQTGAWRRAASEPPANLAADYRTGLNGRVTLRVSGDTLLTIDRLSEARVALARVAPAADEPGRSGDAASAPAGAPGSGTRVVVDLKRGRVRVVPPVGGAVNVVTPEGLTVVREEAVVSHDAEHGTRVRLAPNTPDTPDTPNTPDTPRPNAPSAPASR